MEVVDGTRSGAKNYLFENYAFRVKWKKVNTTYLICSNATCTARATLKENVFRVTKSHNHAAEVEKCQKLKFRENLKTSATKSAESLKKIYYHTAERHQDASANYSFASAECRMRRERKAIKPPFPRSLCSLRDFLESEDWSHLGQTLLDPPGPFFQEMLQGEEGSEILIFCSSELGEELENARMILIDGTFKIIPQTFSGHQLTIIHMVYQNKVYGVLYAIMSRRTKYAYVLLLNFMKQRYRVHPTQSMCDFEVAEIQALQEVFPGISTKGCWFHYAQAIFRKHQKLGLCTLCGDNERAGKILQMLMAIPLLPANRFPDGIEYLQAQIRTSGFVEFAEMMQYVQDFWMQRMGSEILSVFGCARRTNNEVENFHLQLLLQNGKQPHPAVWDFLRILKETDRNETLKFRAQKNGARFAKPQRTTSKEQDARIKEAEQFLLSGDYSVGEFLEVCGHSVKSLERDLRFQASTSLITDHESEVVDAPDT